MDSTTHSTRFDYVQYDEKATRQQSELKREFLTLENLIENHISSPTYKALVFSKLEEAYMWIGKSIRDDQRTRGVPTELNENRTQRNVG